MSSDVYPLARSSWLQLREGARRTITGCSMQYTQYSYKCRQTVPLSPTHITTRRTVDVYYFLQRKERGSLCPGGVCPKTRSTAICNWYRVFRCVIESLEFRPDTTAGHSIGGLDKICLMMMTFPGSMGLMDRRRRRRTTKLIDIYKVMMMWRM